MMEHETILYISDQANSNPVLAALNGTGYEVVSTNRATQGVALLYVMHSFVAWCSVTGQKNRTWRGAYERFAQMFRSLCCAEIKLTAWAHAVRPR